MTQTRISRPGGLLKASLLLLATVAARGQNAGSGPIRYVPGSTRKVCQLTGERDHETHLPTASRTASRFGLVAADLGDSFEYKGRLVFLFGDSLATPTFHGHPNGFSDPPRSPLANDAVAFADPLRPDRIRLDFTTNALGAYGNPVVLGADGKPAITLGTNEVPVAGLALAGRMVVVFATDNPHRNAKPPEPLGFATRSVVGVSEDDGRTFRYCYDLSRGPDARFINVALAHGPDGFLYIWGTRGGDNYRKSAVFFARKQLSDLLRPGGMAYFTGFGPLGAPRFSPRESEAAPLFAEPMEPRHATGELGVEWNPYVKRWVMLYNCQDRDADHLPGIWMRTAEHAWGPWSDPQTIFNPQRDGGYGHFIHRAVTPQDPVDDGLAPPAARNRWGGAYAPSFLSRFTTGDAARGRSTFFYTVSTWIPYGQVVLRSTIERADARKPPKPFGTN